MNVFNINASVIGSNSVPSPVTIVYLCSLLVQECLFSSEVMHYAFLFIEFYMDCTELYGATLNKKKTHLFEMLIC